MAINAALLGLVALQHSVIARPAFKRVPTPEAAERNSYAVMPSLALILLCLFGEPIGGAVWHVERPLGRGLLHTGSAFSIG